VCGQLNCHSTLHRNDQPPPPVSQSQTPPPVVPHRRLEPPLPQHMRDLFTPWEGYEGCFRCGPPDCIAGLHRPVEVSGECTANFSSSSRSIKLAVGLESGQADPAESTSPSVRLSTTFAEMGTQTDLIVVDRLTPIVNFLDSLECTLEASSIPHCFQYRPDQHFSQSFQLCNISDIT